MLILAIILFGMLVGAGAQLILGRSHGRIDWTMAIVAGLVGSFIGGLLISLLSGDGLDLKPSGIIGSLAGAILVTAGWRWWDGRNKPTAADRAAKRSGDPRKSPPSLTQQPQGRRRALSTDSRRRRASSTGISAGSRFPSTATVGVPVTPPCLEASSVPFTTHCS